MLSAGGDNPHWPLPRVGGPIETGGTAVYLPQRAPATKQRKLNENTPTAIGASKAWSNESHTHLHSTVTPEAGDGLGGAGVVEMLTRGVSREPPSTNPRVRALKPTDTTPPAAEPPTMNMHGRLPSKEATVAAEPPLLAYEWDGPPEPTSGTHVPSRGQKHTS